MQSVLCDLERLQRVHAEDVHRHRANVVDYSRVACEIFESEPRRSVAVACDSASGQHVFSLDLPDEAFVRVVGRRPATDQFSVGNADADFFDPFTGCTCRSSLARLEFPTGELPLSGVMRVIERTLTHEHSTTVESDDCDACLRRCSDERSRDGSLNHVEIAGRSCCVQSVCVDASDALEDERSPASSCCTSLSELVEGCEFFLGLGLSTVVFRGDFRSLL